jgi:5-methylcytosine-specific restriction endonuclease McrA
MADAAVSKAAVFRDVQVRVLLGAPIRGRGGTAHAVGLIPASCRFESCRPHQLAAPFAKRQRHLVEYDKWVSSPSTKIRLPSVVALRDYIPMPKRVAFTRFNVFLRDRFRCQYCGETFSAKDLSFEHVIPRSKGGETSWTNIVAACDPCNVKKDNRTNMNPLRAPFVPTAGELMAAKRAFPPG